MQKNEPQLNKNIIKKGIMKENTKLLWRVVYKNKYHFSELYLYCLEDEVETLFNMIAKIDYMQPIELHSIELAGELIDIEEYRPASSGSIENTQKHFVNVLSAYDQEKERLGEVIVLEKDDDNMRNRLFDRLCSSYGRANVTLLSRAIGDIPNLLKDTNE